LARNRDLQKPVESGRHPGALLIDGHSYGDLGLIRALGE